MQLFLKVLAFVAFVLAQAADLAVAFASVNDHQERIRSTVGNSYAEYDTRDCELIDPVIFELVGRYSQYISREVFDSILFDAREATWRDGANRKSSSVIIKHAKNICWIGGRIAARKRQTAQRSTNGSDAVGILIKTSRDSDIVSIDNILISRIFNGLRMHGETRSIVLNNIMMTELTDTCIHLGKFEIATVANSFFDGCETFISLQENHSSQKTTITLQNNIIDIDVSNQRSNVFDSRRRDHVVNLFTENSSGSISLILDNNVFLLRGNREAVRTYLTDVIIAESTECHNNIFILSDEGEYQWDDIDCGFVTNDLTIWERAKNLFINRHSGDRPISDMHDVLFETDSEGRIPNIEGHTGDYDRGRVGVRVDDTTGDGPFSSLSANGIPDVVVEMRRSVEEALARAEQTRAGMASFLGRWADGTLWHDGTGWQE